MIIRVVDLETTGEHSDEQRHATCEVGWTDLTLGAKADAQAPTITVTIGEPAAVLTNPMRAIPPEARAVHHIADEDVKDAPPAANVFMKNLMAGPPTFFCAHSADFERSFFGGGEVPWLCTYKIALRLWPDAPSHKLQVLRYWLGIDACPVRAAPPHRAGPDSYVCALLMARILRDRGTNSIEDMARWSDGPALLSRVMFGKHKGMMWSELPDDYLQWIMRSELDRDAKANAKHHLKKRGKL